MRQALAAPGEDYALFIALSPAWRAALDAALAGCGPMWVRRFEFAFDAPAFAALSDDGQDLPAGCRLVPYDRALVETAGSVPECWGGVDRFLAEGVGYVLLSGEEPVSRCHSVFVGDGIAEIGVETEEAHHRKGCALRTCRADIVACLARGLTPGWSCWDNNAPSVSLAQRLAFRGPTEVPVAILKRPA